MPHTHGLSLLWAVLFAVPAWFIWQTDKQNRRAPLVYLALALSATIITWIIAGLPAPWPPPPPLVPPPH